MKLVLERPNSSETFSTQATEVKNFIILFHFRCHNFKDIITNFDKNMSRKESLLWYKLLQLNEDHIQKCRYFFSTIKPCFLFHVVLF